MMLFPYSGWEILCESVLNVMYMKQGVCPGKAEAIANAGWSNTQGDVIQQVNYLRDEEDRFLILIDQYLLHVTLHTGYRL